MKTFIKMSQQRILQREENKASFALDKLLSAEASRLNYPLKIKVEVKSDEVEKGISSAVGSDPVGRQEKTMRSFGKPVLIY